MCTSTCDIEVKVCGVNVVRCSVGGRGVKWCGEHVVCAVLWCYDVLYCTVCCVVQKSRRALWCCEVLWCCGAVVLCAVCGAVVLCV